MDVNIICWNLKNSIDLSSISSSFKEISKTEEIYYLKMGQKRIEIAISNLKGNKFKERYIGKITHSKLSVIIVDEITKENLSTIESAIKYNNFIVMTGRICIDSNDMLSKKIVILPQLNGTNEMVDINSLIYVLDSIYMNKKFDLNEILGTNIIFGRTESNSPIGEIPLCLLKQFNYLKSLNNLNITLYSENKITAENLIYIEDPLREYIDYGSVLKIKQLINKELMGKIYFSLIAK